MAVSIVVAVSLLSLIWVEILRKSWLHQDRNLLTSGNKMTTWYSDVCLQAGNASRQGMRSQLIGSLGQDTQAAAAAERACLQSSSAHPSRQSPLRERGVFSHSVFPLLVFQLFDQVSKMWTYVHAMVALILFGWWGSPLKAPYSTGCCVLPLPACGDAGLPPSVCTTCTQHREERKYKVFYQELWSLSVDRVCFPQCKSCPCLNAGWSFFV